MPASLTLPHCAADSKRLTVKSRENTDDIWDIDKREQAPLIESTTGSTATIQINHFTGFTLVCMMIRLKNMQPWKGYGSNILPSDQRHEVLSALQA